MTQPRQTNESIHKLFHEAQKRASQPQPSIKYKQPKSLLLSAPNNIIFELFNTVIKEVSSENLMAFIVANLRHYLNTNWANKITQQAIRRLKREQTVDVRAGLVDVPLMKFSTGVMTAKPATTIVDTKLKHQQQQQQQQQQQHQQQSPRSPSGPNSPPTSQQPAEASRARSPPNQGASAAECLPLPTGNHPAAVGPARSPTYSEQSKSLPAGGQKSPPVDYTKATSKQKAIEQIYNHIMWRIQTDNVTQITSLLIKLVLDDGYKKGRLQVESYDEILECFTEWRAQKLIKLYSFGSAPASDQKLILASTTSGDLTKWVANYIDGSEKRQKPELIRVLATALRDKTKNCIFITNELIDALKSLETGAIRCVFLVDRLNHYEPINSMPLFSTQVEPLITSGKLFVMNSLNCVEFAPDPQNDTCC